MNISMSKFGYKTKNESIVFGVIGEDVFSETDFNKEFTIDYFVDDANGNDLNNSNNKGVLDSTNNLIIFVVLIAIAGIALMFFLFKWSKNRR